MTQQGNKGAKKKTIDTAATEHFLHGCKDKQAALTAWRRKPKTIQNALKYVKRELSSHKAILGKKVSYNSEQIKVRTASMSPHSAYRCSSPKYRDPNRYRSPSPKYGERDSLSQYHDRRCDVPYDYYTTPLLRRSASPNNLFRTAYWRADSPNRLDRIVDAPVKDHRRDRSMDATDKFCSPDHDKSIDAHDRSCSPTLRSDKTIDTPVSSCSPVRSESLQQLLDKMSITKTDCTPSPYRQLNMDVSQENVMDDIQESPVKTAVNTESPLKAVNDSKASCSTRQTRRPAHLADFEVQY